MRPKLFLTLTLLSLVLEAAIGAKFLLTAPKKIRYDTEFNVTVTALGVQAGREESVDLRYSGVKDTSRILYSTTLTFSSDGVQTWGATFGWEQMERLEEIGVKLKLSSKQEEESQNFFFGDQTGYIFIQTDKPLYTPRQTVKYRIIAVDEYQKLASHQLKVDIKNQNGIVVDRIWYSPEEAFECQTFELPKETPPGNWSITANFEELDKTYTTVNFEVKEYVLPRFSATLETDKEVITKSTNWITITVKSSYVYGQPLFGRVEMQLGIWEPKKGITLFPNRSAGELNDEGVYREDVRVSELFDKTDDFPEDTRLYINVNVTENATMETDTIEDTSTFISHPYYVVDTSKSKQSFKPGFPYTLHTQVRAKSGTPASWIQLWFQVKYIDDRGRQLPGGMYDTRKLDGNGELEVDFDIPEETEEVVFKMMVLDLKKGSFKMHEFRVPKFRSPNYEYMHITLEQPIQKRQDGKALLRYTKSVNTDSTAITVLVMSKGHILYSTSTVRNSDGQSRVNLPLYLYGETSPSMWIVAYYGVMSSEVEYVIDSLFVKTGDVCLEEIRLFKRSHGGSVSKPKPKDKFNLMVSGTPYMRVGFVAVDKAVFLLNNRQTLTRESMFSKLGTHDLGQGVGDGQTLSEILKNSGLTHIVLDNEKPRKIEPITSKVVGWYNPSMSISRNFFDLAPLHTTEIQVTRPQTIRKNFNESWMFEETELDKKGRMIKKLTFPDSITTWSFLAIGLSANRGVCVSQPLEQEVMKLFFADVRLPYKVTRLEEVKVKIAVYNYADNPVDVNVLVTGSEGMCFPENTVRGSAQNSSSFRLFIGAKRTNSKIVKVIPLKNGDLTLRVDLFNTRERDTVERTLHVVAEGYRIKKSITFVLDPEAKHASFKSVKRNRLTLKKTATVSNVVNLATKQQQTVVNLALPKEVIKGTELCRISAFGDLMGDILTHAVMESKSLMEQPLEDAEEVLGDLGPTVHALLYANKSGLMDKDLDAKGRRFVRHSVTRLLKYKKDDYFVLSPHASKAKPATWLTAAVLKSLCYASSSAFVDRKNLIDSGFSWLLSQVDENGTMNEEDWRLAKNSFEYKVMLSAEVLIAILECHRSEKESHLELQAILAGFLEDNVRNIRQPMAIAKVAYALTLVDPESEFTEYIVIQLSSMRRRNKLGHSYWSSETETNEPRKIPFWYRLGAKAASIEATSYALLVYLHHKGAVNVDAIADWLVAQRNADGAFIGAMDSTVAIQALSQYSLLKHGLEVDLHCDVKGDKLEDTHSFKFTAENATRQELLSSVNVGQSLQVLTKGQGLGQMQINVEYNVPIDHNQHCPFKCEARVTRPEIKWPSDPNSNPLCSSCGFWCEDENKTSNATKETNDNDTLSDLPPDSRMKTQYISAQAASAVRGRQSKTSRLGTPLHRRYPSRRRPSRRERSQRSRRQRRSQSGFHKKSICLEVCLIHLESGPSGPTTVEIEMLTGYKPVSYDVEMMRGMPNVKHVEFLPDTEILKVKFSEIDDKEKTCVGIRAVDEEQVGRPTAASVVVREVGLPYPSCAFEYTPLPGEESLQVFCADFAHLNKGECRCFSGICSRCGPSQHDPEGFDLHSIKQESCKVPVAYKVQMKEAKRVGENMWAEIDATVLAANRTGTHDVAKGDFIKMMSPSSCYCPMGIFNDPKEKPYLLSADVEKLVDRHGKVVHRYLLDENSLFLRVTEPSQIASGSPAVPFIYLQHALSPNNVCEN